MVFVESILLNEQFNEDAKQHLGANCIGWVPFFGPNPPFEARDTFTQYVTARWPLKIFTVDPVSTDQNIADVSLVYREMQLAVALSVASGNLGVGSAVNALRQIQRETATIDLNKVAVGFTHGDDTFGWRFYPRFQTPPVEGNLTVFFRDALIGGPTDKHLEMKKEIEPGMRECTALVIMPSFIKGVSIDSRSNWFRLDKPGHTAVSMQDSMKFSRAVEQMRRNVEQCVCNEHLYRPGEVSRVLNRVRQLDRELPLQTLSCQVPVENALGGFELLSSGTRELAPELLGWYGAPGYDVKQGGTFFVVGNNFSVHETRVIAGGQEISSNDPLAGGDCKACRTAIQGVLDGSNCTECEAAKKLLNKPSVTLISRDVMQVTLPPDLPIVRDRRLQQLPEGTLQDGTNDLPKDETPQYLGYVDVHAATPYGVSGHLLIPVLCGENPCNKKPEPAKPAAASTPAPKVVDIAKAKISTVNGATVVTEVVREIGRSAARLSQLNYDLVKGLAVIQLQELKNDDKIASEVDVRAVLKHDGIVIGEHVFADVPIEGRTMNLGVSQQLDLIRPDGILFRTVAASRRLLDASEEVEFSLDIDFFLVGSGVKDAKAPVTAVGENRLRIRVFKPRSGSITSDRSPAGSRFNGRLNLDFDGEFQQETSKVFSPPTFQPQLDDHNPASLWQPFGPVQPASWESFETSKERISPATLHRAASSSLRWTSAPNPAAKRSSGY